MNFDTGNVHCFGFDGGGERCKGQVKVVPAGVAILLPQVSVSAASEVIQGTEVANLA